MKRTTIQLSICMAAALMGFTSASGQQQEYMVGGPQVVSDQVAAPGTVPDSGSYVGDMSTGEAGCQNCAGGSCAGGKCGGKGGGLLGGLFNHSCGNGECVPRG